MKNYIKFLFFTFIFLNIITYAFSDTYLRVTSNGGPNGYSDTEESRWDDEDGSHVRIGCADPGFENCPTSLPMGGSGIPTQVQDYLTNYALTEISFGNLTGTHVDGDYEVIWESLDNNALNSEINIFEN